ncbi:MAG: hypothetical protein D6732_20245 [Methanobacteriota archaeon]|nr:MAG: hypothetical protein D6732_20245 [Euryarchaeota archaeon]
MTHFITTNVERPDLLIRFQIPEEYRIHARQIKIDELLSHLSHRPAVIFNFYAQAYGIEVKDFKYLPRYGFFVDIETRQATHELELKGIERRDRLFHEKAYQPLVPPIYRETWFDLKDAIRSYAIIITKIEPLSQPIRIEKFDLYESKGKVNPDDELHHPRPIKALPEFDVQTLNAET